MGKKEREAEAKIHGMSKKSLKKQRQARNKEKRWTALQLLEVEDCSINSADIQEEYMQIEIALDSGAGDHVVDDLDAPGYNIVESRGSKNGNHFVGAGGERIENKGQMTMEMRATGTDDIIKSTFQAAKVKRTL